MMRPLHWRSSTRDDARIVSLSRPGIEVGRALGTLSAAVAGAAGVAEAVLISGCGNGETGDRRGLPCWIGLRVPLPLSDSPPAPCVDTRALWSGKTCVYWPLLKSITST